jgi:hypothetical protein
LSYGANFDYPSEPPPPPGATVIAAAQGWDNDDPMRGREIVIDIGSARQVELLEFYRTHFSSTAGWRQGKADPDNDDDRLLCLVSHSDTRYDEYVEIYPYHQGFTSAGPHRYLVLIGRLQVSAGGERTVDLCGVAGAWFPTDL